MSVIQVLTQRVQDFNDKVDFWNLVMLWGLAFAALAAVIIGISTRLVVVRSGQLGAAQTELSNAKDEQLQLELKEKDRQIELVKIDS